jgi:hypothetical protein
MNQTHSSETVTPSGRADLAAEALIKEAQARQRRRQRRNAGVVLLVALIVVAGVVSHQGTGPKAAITAAPSAATIGTTWRSAGLTAWRHGEPGNFLGAGPSSTISCAGPPHPACYVVVQANGYQPDGSPTVPGVVPGASPYRSSAYRSNNGGATWEDLTVPPDTWLSTALACSGPSTCAVGAVTDPGQDPDVSGTAVVLTTSDGGRTWARATLPAGVGMLTDLACPTSSHCVALAWGHDDVIIDGMPPSAGSFRFYPTSVLTTDDGGTRWRRSATPPLPAGDVASLSSVSCPTAQRCVVIGEQARIVTHDGAYQTEDGTGLVLSSDDGGRVLTTSVRVQGIPVAVSCSGPWRCLAIVQGALDAAPSLLTGGIDGSWSPHSQSGLPSGSGGDPVSLSCPSSGHCLAAGPGGLAVTADGGRRWTVTGSVSPLPPGYGSDLVGQASCLASGTCLVLDDMFPAPTVVGPGATRVLTNSTGS